MTQRTRMTVGVVVAALALAVPAGAQNETRSQHEAKREQWQKVGEIFAAMAIQPGSRVADVGAGDGFFTSRLSSAVGASGRVYAVDVSTSSLDRLRARVQRESLANVEVIEGAIDDPRLPAGTLDAILIVNAYHEMRQYEAMLARMKAALKPDGRLVIVEPLSESRRASSRDQQTSNHEIAAAFVQQDIRQAGFKQVSLRDPFTERDHGDDEWLLVARPATEAEGAWAATQSANWEAQDLRISMNDFKAMPAGSALVLDVRDKASYRDGHLPGAILMTALELTTPEGVRKLKEDGRPVIAYCSCEAEQTSARAAIALKAAGVSNVKALVGGYEEWLRRGEPIVKGTDAR